MLKDGIGFRINHTHTHHFIRSHLRVKRERELARPGRSSPEKERPARSALRQFPPLYRSSTHHVCQHMGPLSLAHSLSRSLSLSRALSLSCLLSVSLSLCHALSPAAPHQARTPAGLPAQHPATKVGRGAQRAATLGAQRAHGAERASRTGAPTAARARPPDAGGQMGGWGRTIKHTAPTGVCAGPAQTPPPLCRVQHKPARGGIAGVMGQNAAAHAQTHYPPASALREAVTRTPPGSAGLVSERPGPAFNSTRFPGPKRHSSNRTSSEGRY